jgi:NhaP-type Na+/H+ or K+/H+ antiporter
MVITRREKGGQVIVAGAALFGAVIGWLGALATPRRSGRRRVSARSAMASVGFVAAGVAVAGAYSGSMGAISAVAGAGVGAFAAGLIGRHAWGTIEAKDGAR